MTTERKTDRVIKSTKQKDRHMPVFLFGSPTENRTPDSALRGRRLNRLTMRPRAFLATLVILS